ncbi:MULTISPECIES: hypothetical protein [Paraburkholderia]|uniref:Uncharacterized protein n=1 Tax=Paraburkholderia fungorum TaxID=134537 RepID=A0A420G086_9BURK|nr:MULTISPECIES: hypothetical protein [Paraburkholderia]MBK5119921.1 hypothetical protein [Burkholderia sp. R-69980]MBK5178655.1 hypothetical protein [Burkholderia sp. R-69749]RKF38609.1 hypothetical protein BCY88_34195 [Paraburkholderia fungorum]CAE6781353.1 hypothetical protein R69749_01708 [Paraburkholderia domus]
MKLLRVIFFLLVGLSAIGLCTAGFYFGQGIVFAQQWPLFEALRNTASIIFAVVGAWLAIIYPERLKLSMRGQRQKRANGDNMGLLLTPVVHSTFLLVALLLIGVSAPLIKQLPAVQPHLPFFRGVSFLILVLLTLWQVVIVVLTIFPAELVKTADDIGSGIAATHDHYEKLFAKKKRPPARNDEGRQ